MNYKKIFWGFILVTLGVLLILKNLGLLWFSWHSIWHLWPVLLILWGISLLPVRDLYKVIISVLIIILSLIFFSRINKENDDDFHWDSDWDDEITAGVDNQKLSEAYDTTIRTALLQFDAAAGVFKLSDTTSMLIDLKKSGIIGNYSMEIGKEGDSATINVKMQGQKNIHTNKGNHVEMKINPLPFWNFDLNVGAAEVNLDLSKFKVRSLDIDGGACSVELKLGVLQNETNLNIETGASSITLLIPKDAGCEVNTNTFLTSKELEGFTNTEGNNYQTTNFKIAKQKIHLDLNAAISSLKIQKY